ncbi:MAG: hypothetical protein R3C19_17610 [Planctomycetaceae bacterium]
MTTQSKLVSAEMPSTTMPQPSSRLEPAPQVVSQPVPQETIRQAGPRRKLQKRRFATGLLLSMAGMATILLVAVGGLQDAGLRGRISMPAIALCVIVGVMMLGGGFGLMATAAPGFDDEEFDRLMRAGDPGNAPRR